MTQLGWEYSLLRAPEEAAWMLEVDRWRLKSSSDGCRADRK